MIPLSLSIFYFGKKCVTEWIPNIFGGVRDWALRLWEGDPLRDMLFIVSLAHSTYAFCHNIRIAVNVL